MPAAKPLRQMTTEERDLVTANIGLAGRVADRLRHHVRPGDLDDLHAAALFGLCRAALDFDEGRRVRFSTYGTKLSHTEALDHLRRSMRLKHRALDLAEPLDDELVARPGRESAAREEERQWIHAAVDRLPERLALIVRNRLAGNEYEAIGRRLGVCQDYVRRLEKLAHEMLRAALGDTE